MANALWTGRISFGLVNVPVKLFTAVKSKTVRFNQLHGKDHARIETKRVSAADGKEVAYADIVKGFEIEPGTFVVLEPAELATLSLEKTSTMEIEGFVELQEIDPIYYDHAYYLAPADEGAEKPYRLLLEVMRESGKVALARFVMRSKEHLIAIRPMQDVLAVATMNFADEIVPVKQLPGIPERQPEVSARERDIAHQILGELAVEFDPAKYHDTYRQAVRDLIEQKAQGKKITAAEPAPAPESPVPDLMSALQASLDAVRKRDGNKSASKPKARKPAKAAPGKAAAGKAASGAGAPAKKAGKPSAKPKTRSR
jgi:DNA end-binding protein Ku